MIEKFSEEFHGELRLPSTNSIPDFLWRKHKSLCENCVLN